MTTQRLAVFATIVLALSASACSNDATSPTGVTMLLISTPTPAAGSTIQTTGTSPGMFIERGSGKLSVPVTIHSRREVENARLWLYLLTDGGYCGQNLPDTPFFASLSAAQDVTVTVTGFQVGRPCEVTGIRAILHTRPISAGLLTPPGVEETIAETTLNVRYSIR